MKVPWTLLGYIAAGLLIIAGANHALGFIPFTPQWSAKRAVASAERLEGQVSSLERTAEGNAVIGQAVETHHTREIVYRDIQSQAEAEARTAPDADTPLSQERADRLRRHDDRVCASAAVTCSTTDAALGRPGAVSPDGPAGEPDAG